MPRGRGDAPTTPTAVSTCLTGSLATSKGEKTAEHTSQPDAPKGAKAPRY